MFKRKYLNILLGLVVAAGLAVIPLTAGGQDGRPANSKPGAATPAADGGGVDDAGTWDGDGPAPRDQVILDDLIVDGSACIGLDCVNGESFGFDTVRLKENNTRLKFDDTSTSASFPRNDWQLTANDSSNGGQEKFSIDDITNARTPFTIEATAPSHSLYVDDGGRIGFGTSTPVVNLHVKDGNTPTLRLEQDGSDGFSPQTWDVAGNEANFFVRDVTNGSLLSFKIKPGAPTNSLFVAADGAIGNGTATPAVDDGIHIFENGGAGATPQIMMTNNDADHHWQLTVRNNGVFALTKVNSAGVGLSQADALFQPNGDLRIKGSLLAEGGDGNLDPGDTFPDYVFDTGYSLMSLGDLREFVAANGHLPGVMSADDVAAEGAINMTLLQLQLLEKVEELTLYTLAQQDVIDGLQTRLAQLEGMR